MYLKHPPATTGTAGISPPSLPALQPVLPILRTCGNPRPPGCPWPWRSLDADRRSPFLPRTAKPKDRPFREREAGRNCAAALPGRGAGKENFLRRLGGDGDRGKGGGGARIVCRSVTQRDSQGLRPPREGGHPSTRVQGSERRAVPGASAPGRNRGVLQGREGAPAPAPPRHTSWVTVVGQEGYRKR